MNTLTQIGIGLIPGTLILIGYIFKRKLWHLKSFIVSGVFIFVCVGLLLIGQTRLGGITSYRASSKASQSQMIRFANALYMVGSYDESQAVMDKYDQQYTYDEEAKLLHARLLLVEDKFEEAKGIYENLALESKVIDQESPEYLLATHVPQETDNNDLIMMNYIQSVGKDPVDYGYESTTANETFSYADLETERLERQNKKDTVIDSIQKSIQEQYDVSDNLKKCAQMVTTLDTKFDDIIEDPYYWGYTGESTSQYERKLRFMVSQEKGLSGIEEVRSALLKASIIGGKYDHIARRLSDDSTYEEVLVAADLYMKGYIDAEAFPKDFQVMDEKSLSDVRDYLERMKALEHEDWNVQQQKEFTDRIEWVEKALDDPIAVSLQDLLNEQSSLSDVDQSKIHLELAKIDDYLGFKNTSYNELLDAIEGAPRSEDYDYQIALKSLDDYINNDGESDSEEIKNVYSYVESAVTNGLIVDLKGLYPISEWDETVFADSVTSTISQNKQSINIGKIDTSEFKHVKAQFQLLNNSVDDIESLKKSLEVSDTGEKIENFTIKKVDYSQSNLLLCVDISLSMEDSMSDLREAVVKFIQTKNEDENVAMEAFAGSIEAVYPLGSSEQQIINTAQDLYCGLGTDIFSATKYAVDSFNWPDDENNIVIVLTDGQDNYPRTQSEIEMSIGSVAREKGIKIYTLGLGEDVDINYLNSISNGTNGDFLYVQSSSSLDTFYDMIHQQVNNTYEIEYDAVNQDLISGRSLTLSIPSKNYQDTKVYSLDVETSGESTDQVNGEGENQPSDTAESPAEELPDQLEAEDEGYFDVTMTTLNPSRVYNDDLNTDLYLEGRHFKPEDIVSVYFSDSKKYLAKETYVDSEHYKLSIPQNIPLGSYKVIVNVNGTEIILKDSFDIIRRGQQDEFIFGPYRFTADQVIYTDYGEVSLKGSVKMNNWLRFKGDLTLSGDIETGSAIDVKDSDGFYIEYSAKTADGVAEYLAQNSIPLEFDELGYFKLYKDMNCSESNYPVDTMKCDNFDILNVASFNSMKMSIYPWHLDLDLSLGNTALPYKDRIMKGFGRNVDILSLDMKGTACITDENIGVIASAEYGDAEYSEDFPKTDDYNHAATLFGKNVYFNGSAEGSIDTLNQEYSLGAMVKLAFLKGNSGLGFNVSWKGGPFQLDSAAFKVNTERGVQVMMTPVPVTANHFSFEVGNIQEAIEKGNFGNLKFTGGAQFACGQLKDYFPALTKFVGDISLFEMPDAKASLSLSPLQVNLSSSLQILSEITIAKADLRLGQFKYSNDLLDLNQSEVTGLSASLTEGIMWESAGGRLNLNLTGKEEFDALYPRFFGIYVDGQYNYDFRWWFLRKHDENRGQMTVGLYRTHDDVLEFILKGKYRNKDAIKGFYYYINENGKVGSKSDEI